MKGEAAAIEPDEEKGAEIDCGGLEDQELILQEVR